MNQHIIHLDQACKLGDIESVKRILPINSEYINSNRINSALYTASKFGHVDIIKYLMMFININFIPDIYLESRVRQAYKNIFEAAMLHKQPNIIDYMITCNCINFINKNEILGYACENGYLNIVKYLISNNADISDDNNYPLRIASTNGHYDIVQYLIFNNADINDLGYMALGNACKYNHYDIAKYLISHNVSIDNTCFRYAILNQNYDILYLLLNNIKDTDSISETYIDQSYQIINERHFSNIENSQTTSSIE